MCVSRYDVSACLCGCVSVWDEYRSLSTEIMAFPDTPFPSELPSFLHHSSVRQYLEAYAEEHDLMQYIRFQCPVVSVEPQEECLCVFPIAVQGHW